MLLKILHFAHAVADRLGQIAKNAAQSWNISSAAEKLIFSENRPLTSSWMITKIILTD